MKIGMGMGICNQRPVGRRNMLPNTGTTGAVLGVVGSGGALPTGWAVNSAGGLATQVVLIGTDSAGLPAVDVKFSGTPSAAAYTLRFNLVDTVPAAATQQWVASFYASLAGGTGTNIAATQAAIIEEAAGGAFVTSAFTAFSLGPRVRGQHPRTLTGGTTAGAVALLRLSLTIGLAVDVTIRISGAQLERGSVPTAVQIVG